jgi:hypothetical protein
MGGHSGLSNLIYRMMGRFWSVIGSKDVESPNSDRQLGSSSSSVEYRVRMNFRPHRGPGRLKFAVRNFLHLLLSTMLHWMVSMNSSIWVSSRVSFLDCFHFIGNDCWKSLSRENSIDYLRIFHSVLEIILTWSLPHR